MSEASGKILLRLPVSLHSRLQRMAEEQGVSLNQLLVALIAEGVGRYEGKAEDTTASRAS